MNVVKNWRKRYRKKMWRDLTKKEKELIELVTEYSSCYSKEKLHMFIVIKFDEIKKEDKEV